MGIESCLIGTIFRTFKIFSALLIDWVWQSEGEGSIKDNSGFFLGI